MTFRHCREVMDYLVCECKREYEEFNIFVGIFSARLHKFSEVLKQSFDLSFNKLGTGS